MSITATDEELDLVVRILREHRGRKNAITIDQLCQVCGFTNREGRLDRRKCELILQIYAEHFPFIICGASEGIFVATEPEDLNHERNSRMSRIKNIAEGWRTRRRKALALGWKMESGQFVEAPKQMELAFQ